MKGEFCAGLLLGLVVGAGLAYTFAILALVREPVPPPEPPRPKDPADWWKDVIKP